MAYTRKPSVFKVSFEEPHALAGLTLHTRALSIKDFAAFGLKMGQFGDDSVLGTDVERLEALTEQLGVFDDIRVMFADALISWDVEDEDGTPAPPTVDGVNSLSDEEFITIVSEWLEAIGGVDAGLGKDSGSGESIPVLSDLMEPLSSNLAS